jgi:hypothetical protein
MGSFWCGEVFADPVVEMRCMKIENRKSVKNMQIIWQQSVMISMKRGMVSANVLVMRRVFWLRSLDPLKAERLCQINQSNRNT